MTVSSHPRRRRFSPWLLAALTPLLFYLFLSHAEAQVEAEGLRRVEEAVRRAAVECYALEGAYPETLDYLRRHYALSTDASRYFIAYDFLGSNLMPDITVLPVSEEGQLAQQILGDVAP